MGAGRMRVPAAVTDSAIAAGVAALLVGGGLSGEYSGAEPGLLGFTLLAAGGPALVLWRRAPRTVLAVTGVCAVGYQAAGFDVLAVSYLVAVYGTVRAGHRAFTAAASAVLLVALHLTALALRDGPVGQVLMQPREVLEIAWLVAAFAAGEAVRQAERRADEAERTREETARRRADEERLTIARELHDSLTHQISIIKVQAEVAVHTARRRGERVPEALLAIQEAGREATRELAATLQALRSDRTGAPRGLDDIPELVERAATPGLETTLTIEGRRPEVPDAVGRTAYRIVQESLTNVARHSAATTASVRIGYRPGALVLHIDDDGTAAPGTAPPPGLGLLGMRERVTALGGRFHAGPRAAGGFAVRAELPVDHKAPPVEHGA